MTETKPIRRVAVVGSGVIGASWSALFLANGLKVVAHDIAPSAEASLRKFVKAAWPTLERLGLSPGAVAVEPGVHDLARASGRGRRSRPGKRT